MHEAAAAHSIVKAACLVASEREAGIRALTLEVDHDASDPVAIEWHMRAAAIGTAVEDAHLIVRNSSGLGHGAIRLVSVTLVDL
jgi:Zn finger protein HypA/HybF involved in hydrogenase expression